MKTSDPASFRELLSHDHVRLDAMLTAVLELTHSNIQPNLAEEWAVYEEALLVHLNAEEMLLLPGLAKHDAAFAARIRDEHTKIRALLAEIGVGLELHIVREERMLELAQYVRQHAKLEEQPLYTWADSAIPEGSYRLAFRRLRALWQRIHLSVTALKEHSSKPTPAPLGSPPANAGRS